MVDDEKVIFKLKISLWAKIISAVQIVYNAFSLIGSIYGLISLGSITIYLAYFVLHLFGVACGVLLFMGIRRQKTTFLIGWVGSACAIMVVYIVGVLVSGGSNVLGIIGAVIAIPLHAFGIFIVYNYKQEVKAKTGGSSLPTVH